MDCRLPNGRLSPGCDKENQPSAKEACNIRPCPTWMTGEWGRVSTPFTIVFCANFTSVCGWILTNFLSFSDGYQVLCDMWLRSEDSLSGMQ